MKNVIFIFIGILILIIINCAGPQKITSPTPAIKIPPGVDSTVAKLADSTAKELFVSFEEEEKAEEMKKEGNQSVQIADSILKFIKILEDTTQKISDEQKQEAIKFFNKGAIKLKRIINIQEKIQKGGLSSEDLFELKKLAYSLLIEAKKAFEESLRHNPFDLDARNALAWILGKIVSDFQERNQENYYQLINILTELIGLNRGEHQLYFNLAQAYYLVKDWNNALNNFRKGRETLINYAFLNLPENTPREKLYSQLSPEDSLNLYTYYYYESQVFIQLEEADSAMQRLNKALELAQTSDDQKNVKYYIDWINWDNGNIKASKWRDKILENYAETNNHQMAITEFEKLERILITQKARDEIEWQIAKIEYKMLNLPEQGISRLSRVIFKTPQDNRGCPVDSSYQKYFEDFAIMCYNLAAKNIKKKISRKVAYAYLLQGTRICSSVRGKLYVELAKMARYNPTKSLEFAIKALQYLDLSEESDLADLFKYFIEVYRRLGNREQVRFWYEISLSAQSKLWKDVYYYIANATIQYPIISSKWAEFAIVNYKSSYNKEELNQLYAIILNGYKRINEVHKLEYWYREWQNFKKE